MFVEGFRAVLNRSDFRIDTCDTVQAVRLGKQMYTQFVGQHTLPSGLLRDLRSQAPSGQNPALVGLHVSCSRACCQAVGCRRHAGLHHLPVPRISSQYGWQLQPATRTKSGTSSLQCLRWPTRETVWEKRDGVEEGLQYVKAQAVCQRRRRVELDARGNH